MIRTLTKSERSLIARALHHIATEYATASLEREQTGDGRSIRMRLARHASNANELAWVIRRARSITLDVER